MEGEDERFGDNCSNDVLNTLNKVFDCMTWLVPLPTTLGES